MCARRIERKRHERLQKAMVLLLLDEILIMWGTASGFIITVALGTSHGCCTTINELVRFYIAF